MQVVQNFEIPGQFPVKLEQRASGAFRVTYGAEVKDNLTYSEAAEQMGYCLMHAMACNSLINDNWS